MTLSSQLPRIAGILALVFICGCSDDGAGPPPGDTGSPSGDTGGADTVGSTDKGPGLDGTPTPDSTPPSVCEETCRQQSVYLCVKDGAGGCVECLDNKHCKGNPDADGPACDTSTNQCEECTNNNHAFCVGHPSGPVCDGDRCVCAKDADCAGATSGTKCVTFPALNRCGCEADLDCQGSPLGSICNTSFNKKCICNVNGDCKDAKRTACQLPYHYADYGQCGLPCKSDADCGKERLTRCKVGDGRCVECTGDGHCQGVDRGLKCMPDSTCGCTTKADCPPNEICDVDLSGKKVCQTP